jgi:hypothetical protein
MAAPLAGFLTPGLTLGSFALLGGERGLMAERVVLRWREGASRYFESAQHRLSSAGSGLEPNHESVAVV